MLNNLVLDLRYAVRMLGRNRTFVATAVLTLALGIAANGAIFAIVHGVLFRPLPYADPSRLVAVTRITDQSASDNHSAADFLDVRRESRSFAALAGYRMGVMDLSGGGGEPERVSSAEVTPTFFDVFGVPALAGRTFDASRDTGERLVVLGHTVWQRRFAGDRSIVGRTIRVDREPCTVVGVMPASFRFPGDAHAWVLAARDVPSPPLTVEGDLLANRQVHYFNSVARLKTDVPIERARAELVSIAASLGARYPQTNKGQSLGVIPLHEIVSGASRANLFILLGAVAFVLLVACANVASLALARATGRRHELAMRIALGAGRARLVRQLLVESLVVGLAASAAGLLGASWGLDLLKTVIPEDLIRGFDVGLDGTVALFTLAVGMGAALVFGIVPALLGSRDAVLSALRMDENRVGGQGGAMSGLVVMEVAAGIVLAAGAGLMVATLLRLQAVDPGFRQEGVVRVPLPLPTTRYGNSTQQARLYTEVLDKLALNPQTRASAAAFPLPLTGAGAAGNVQVEGKPWVNDRERPVAAVTWVSPNYFKVLGITIKRGRDVDARDVKNGPPVAVVSEAAASRFWPSEDPVGKRFSFGDEQHPAWFTVVGVVGDIRHEALPLSPVPMLYFPLQQDCLPYMTVVVRSDAGVARVTEAVRAAVRQVDPELPVGDAGPLSSLVGDSLAEQRLRARLLSAFAAVALLLAATGVYGLLSYRVAGRRREIGIRLALGASPGRVVASVVAEGMTLAAVGICIGVPAAWGLARIVQSQLFGVTAGDPLTLSGVSALLAAVALLACWLPARRVFRIDPVIALRAE